MTDVNRVWRLRKRPVGALTDDVLEFCRGTDPRTGRWRMPVPAELPLARPDQPDLDERHGRYMPPVELGEPMRGVVCGTVVKIE